MDEKVRKAAFFLTKSLPRQTNCCKWREASGYSPNLLAEMKNGEVKLGDLVFFESFEGIVYLIVRKDELLTDNNQFLDVSPVNSEKVKPIAGEKLMTDNDLILVVPSYLFSTDNNGIIFTDVAQEIFSNIVDKQMYSSLLSDDEWALLLSSENAGPVTEKSKEIATIKGIFMRALC